MYGTLLSQDSEIECCELCACLASYIECCTTPYHDRLLGNKVCDVGRIATVIAGVSLPLATVLVTSSGVLRLRILSSICSSLDLA